ncbi:MAG: stage III sporulation protein AF [Lachnospiraceae bacterium]|nr:stage III sporulation protein AF [Lachnospiraceae bacterium]
MKMIQSCVLFFIVFTIMMELLPSGSFQKYMKLMGGLMFLMLFFQTIFGTEKLLPSLYRNYYKHVQQSPDMAEGKEALMDEYQEQLETQICSFLEQDGYEVARVRVMMKDQQLSKVTIRLKHADEYDAIQVKNKLLEVYSLDESHINVES